MIRFQAAVERMVAAARRTRAPERDVALVYTMFCTGLYPLEVARLRVADYLRSSGAIRHVSVLREEASFRNYSRPLLWANRSLCTAVDEYLAFRREVGFGTGRSDRYRGLDPSSPLFLTNEGTSFSQRDRNGSNSYPGFILLFNRIAAEAGIEMSAREARRALAARMFELGGDVDRMRDILGIKKDVEFFRFISADLDAQNSVGRLTPLLRRVL